MIRSIFILGLLLFLGGCLPGLSEWGNRISFINELGIEIDSLSFTACDSTTMLQVIKHTGEEPWIEDNPAFPEAGYPCPVKIRVYAGGQTKDLLATPYDCYHCDNSKYYILRGDSAVFQVHYARE